MLSTHPTVCGVDRRNHAGLSTLLVHSSRSTDARAASAARWSHGCNTMGRPRPRRPGPADAADARGLLLPVRAHRAVGAGDAGDHRLGELPRADGRIVLAPRRRRRPRRTACRRPRTRAARPWARHHELARHRAVTAGRPAPAAVSRAALLGAPARRRRAGDTADLRNRRVRRPRRPRAPTRPAERADGAWR